MSLHFRVNYHTFAAVVVNLQHAIVTFTLPQAARRLTLDRTSLVCAAHLCKPISWMDTNYFPLPFGAIYFGRAIQKLFGAWEYAPTRILVYWVFSRRMPH